MIGNKDKSRKHNGFRNPKSVYGAFHVVYLTEHVFVKNNALTNSVFEYIIFL